MSHTYSNLLVHVIFSTQERGASITSEIEPDLLAYIGGIMRRLRGKALAVGGTNDHLHLLMRTGRSILVFPGKRVTPRFQ